MIPKLNQHEWHLRVAYVIDRAHNKIVAKVPRYRDREYPNWKEHAMRLAHDYASKNKIEVTIELKEMKFIRDKVGSRVVEKIAVGPHGSHTVKLQSPEPERWIHEDLYSEKYMNVPPLPLNQGTRDSHTPNAAGSNIIGVFLEKVFKYSMYLMLIVFILGLPYSCVTGSLKSGPPRYMED